MAKIKAIRPSKTADKILASARDLFLSKGYSAVSMESIARESKTSKATAYAHYKTKENLFLAVLDIEIQRINAGVLDIDRGSSNVPATLRRISQNFISVFLIERTFTFQRTVVGAVPLLPGLGKSVYCKGPTKVMNDFASYLTEASRKGLLKIDDPDLAARQFFALIRLNIDNMGILAMKLPTRDRLEHYAESAIAMFIRYYAPDQR